MADDAAQVLSRSHQVDALLTRKDKIGALNVSLQNPPITADKTVKAQNADVVEKVLMTFNEADIANALNALTLEQCDVLMKYVYKLMEKEKSTISALLLKLHAQLVEKVGVGSIMRTLVDRKTV